MKTNMGSLDRLVRVVAALVVVVLYATGLITGTLATILLVVAGIFILTSFFSFCPLYYPFGISTRKKLNSKA
ncbi:YgaP family membrane protein [Negadavirga shengliensis]|uniref:DUF2892 domain-containing protein n=1 Tax=Negadavirga shengliensis TaxID=1389218 RepID=A0ABV9SVG9_9BACT